MQGEGGDVNGAKHLGKGRVPTFCITSWLKELLILFEVFWLDQSVTYYKLECSMLHIFTCSKCSLVFISCLYNNRHFLSGFLGLSI